jgi:DNA-binding MarR family transcriptional regulator
MNNRKQKVEELMEGMHSLSRRVAFRSSHFAKMPKITPSQWGALMIIEGSGESTVKDVARAQGVTSSAATQLIDGLVKSGYVLRKTYTKDRRILKLTLSKKTKTQVNKMKKEAVQNFLMLFETLSDKEFNQYILLNKKIVEKFK